MAADTRVIAFRIPEADAKRFEQAARASRYRTPARALRQMVAQVSGQATGAVMPREARSVERKDGRLIVRINKEDAEAAKAIAAEYGGLTPWVRGLIDQALGRSSERPAQSEVQALYQATAQLWRVGTNLNQAVHRLNEAHRAGEPLPNSVTPALLKRVMQAVEALAHKNDALVIAARRRGSQRV